MTETAAEERMLVDYLLGRASANDATAFEDRWFVDDELFARLEDAADDLAAAYVRHRLSPDDRQRFEHHCLGSSDDRLRLRVARAVAMHRAAVPASTAPTLLGRLASLLTPRGGGRLVMLAATVCLAVGASWLALKVTQLRHEIGQIHSQLAEQRGAIDAASTVARDIGAERDALARRLADLTAVRFNLTPGTDWSGGVELLLPPDARVLRLDLTVDWAAPTGRYRAVLRTASRVQVWSAAVTAQLSAEQTLALEVPTGSITSGQYEVVLEAVGTDGSFSEIATYSFIVGRRG